MNTYKSLAKSKITRRIYDEWVDYGKTERTVKVPVDLCITRIKDGTITYAAAVYGPDEILEIPGTLFSQLGDYYKANLLFPCATSITTTPKGVEPLSLP